jgi:hypothetical protein
MTWAERKVIECAGLKPEDATAEIVKLAGVALEQYYYIDRAAEWLIGILCRRETGWR